MPLGVAVVFSVAGWSVAVESVADVIVLFPLVLPVPLVVLSSDGEVTVVLPPGPSA